MEAYMKKTQPSFFAATVLALAIISTALLPVSTYSQTSGGDSGAPRNRPRMHRMLGTEAPWISIALNHKSELNLSADQVANLEKIRTHYRDQTTPVQEQLRAIEGEIAALLQETPANLIQAKLKIEQAEKLRSQLRYLRVEALENGKSVLTAQQRDQLKNLASSRHPGFRKQQGQTS
jgi:Spy/CpxP family protein refolding chaperone